MRLGGKIAVVTGGGRGLGAAVARAFDAEGATVAILDVDGDQADATAQALEGGVGLACDVSRSSDVDACFARVVTTFGTVDILANIAGVSASMAHWEHISPANRRQEEELRSTGRIASPLEATQNTSDEEWQRVLDINLTGTFFCTRAALRVMGPQGSGVIINTASNSAVTGWPGIAHYAASKGGVLSFTRSVAREVILQGVRVNVVAPGGIDTPMMREKPEDFSPGPRLPLPIGRLCEPAELAAVYVFLASEESSYMVGETVNVNGGVHTV